MNPISKRLAAWPELPYAAWSDTLHTLHMWTQVAGKLRLALAPYSNHWWHVPLYVDTRGLTTSPMPWRSLLVEVRFDFLAHTLSISTSNGEEKGFPLGPYSVSEFYQQTCNALNSLGIDVPIWPVPVEIAEPIRFDQDERHHAYDPEYAWRFWQSLLRSTAALQRFRGEFIGKCSPVHFFWGSFDLAVTRFSGRAAPPHPGAPNISDRITREAYSHEVSSAGFWPGGPGLEEPIFYSYAYPEPEGFAGSAVLPAAAYYHPVFREFVLPYDSVRTAPDPEAALLDFCRSTYAAAANQGTWDRASLERGPVKHDKEGR